MADALVNFNVLAHQIKIVLDFLFLDQGFFPSFFVERCTLQEHQLILRILTALYQLLCSTSDLLEVTKLGVVRGYSETAFHYSVLCL